MYSKKSIAKAIICLIIFSIGGVGTIFCFEHRLDASMILIWVGDVCLLKYVVNHDMFVGY